MFLRELDFSPPKAGNPVDPHENGSGILIPELTWKIAKAPQSEIEVYPDLSGLRSDKLSHSKNISLPV
ncbi:MAG: hypothetical protein AMJ89_04140 [candidate division Zixibacteria bacterium SM23_73]|nr:MAG: hypothetical protein AMJ89_04140 [candidate division Zixibacteria bacterium SM23_73]